MRPYSSRNNHEVATALAICAAPLGDPASDPPFRGNVDCGEFAFRRRISRVDLDARPRELPRDRPCKRFKRRMPSHQSIQHCPVPRVPTHGSWPAPSRSTSPTSCAMHRISYPQISRPGLGGTYKGTNHSEDAQKRVDRNTLQLNALRRRYKGLAISERDCCRNLAAELSSSHNTWCGFAYEGLANAGYSRPTFSAHTSSPPRQSA